MDTNKTRLDRMMYVKDKYPSLFAICAIVLNVFYFVLIYKINKDYFYNGMIGVSIITNLLFMLFAFLCSEEVKNYHSQYGYVMIGLAVLEIIRIFIFPLKAVKTIQAEGDSVVQVMTNGQFITCVICLAGAAVLLVIGGLMSIKNAKTLNDYKKSIGK